MESIAPLDQALGTAAKLHRLLREAGLTEKALHTPIDDVRVRQLLVDRWNLLATAPGYQLARDILGQDFITPQEVVAARGLTYSEKQFTHFVSSLPKKEILQWARNNGFMLVAGPPSEMSLMDIYELNPDLFGRRVNLWTDECPNFARQDRVEEAWLILHKDPATTHTSRTWDKQLGDNERIPNIAETVWGFTTYAEVRDIRLVSNKYVRTSSVHDGSRVYVGDFDEQGLVVGYHWSCGFLTEVGIASVRK